MRYTFCQLAESIDETVLQLINRCIFIRKHSDIVTVTLSLADSKKLRVSAYDVIFRVFELVQFSVLYLLFSGLALMLKSWHLDCNYIFITSKTCRLIITTTISPEIRRFTSIIKIRSPSISTPVPGFPPEKGTTFFK